MPKTLNTKTTSRTRHMRVTPYSTLIMAIASTLAFPAHAALPTIETCKKLQSDLSDLERSGIKSDMEKGPEWVKSNLPAERVTEILRYLKTYEQIEFRCEYVFAAYEAQELARMAAHKARERAIANMPPLPVRKPISPSPTQVSTKATATTVIPPPKRPEITLDPGHSAQPSTTSAPSAYKLVPKSTQKLWDTKVIDKTQ